MFLPMLPEPHVYFFLWPNHFYDVLPVDSLDDKCCVHKITNAFWHYKYKRKNEMFTSRHSFCLSRCLSHLLLNWAFVPTYWTNTFKLYLYISLLGLDCCNKIHMHLSQSNILGKSLKVHLKLCWKTNCITRICVWLLLESGDDFRGINTLFDFNHTQMPFWMF